LRDKNDYLEKYGSGENGFLNNAYIIFSVYYDGMRPKQSTLKPYKLTCRLPGIKSTIGHFEREEAKEKAEEALRYWLNKSGLQMKRTRRKSNERY